MKYVWKIDNPLLPHEFTSQGTPPTINIRCPHCSLHGAFDRMPHIQHDQVYMKMARGATEADHVERGVQISIGGRRCPNLKCHGIVVVAYLTHSNPIETVWVSPPQLIDFDASSVPDKITESIREAIVSHSVGAYRASAIMVRRTLELVCEDKGASGPDLKQRIEALAQHVTLPPRLLEAADKLRLLGNDAAHVIAKVYSDIDDRHASVAIELTKRIVQAVYQHDDLVSQLESLKSP